MTDEERLKRGLYTIEYTAEKIGEITALYERIKADLPNEAKPTLIPGTSLPQLTKSEVDKILNAPSGYTPGDAMANLNSNRERNKKIAAMMNKEFIDEKKQRRIFTADDARKFRYMKTDDAITEMKACDQRMEETKKNEAEKAIDDLSK